MVCKDPERFLFATDYPHENPGGLKKQEDVGLLEKNVMLNSAEKQMLFPENAPVLFGLCFSFVHSLTH